MFYQEEMVLVNSGTIQWGEIMVSVPYYVFSGGSGEESILGESLGVIIWS